MKKSIKFYRFLIAILVISSTVLFNACSNTRSNQSTLNQKKWVDWKIIFKENTSDKDKQLAFIALEKYILNYVANLDNPTIILNHISFNRNINASSSGLTVTTGYAATEAAPTVTIPPKPPRKPIDFLPNLKIEDIQ